MKHSPATILALLLFLLAPALLLAQDDDSPLTRLEPIVRAWNAAIDQNNPDALNALYADDVMNYGQALPRFKVVEAKRAWLAKNPSYQQWVEDLIVREYLGELEVTFTKVTVLSGKKSTYQGILGFDPETFKITRESDQTTEVTLSKRAQALPPPQGRTCVSLDGTIWPPIAMAAPYSYTLNLDIQGSQVKASGSQYNWSMRSMYMVEATGTISPDNLIHLTVTMYSPLYDPEDEEMAKEKFTYTETWKWTGNGLRWAEPEYNSFMDLPTLDCEE